MGECYRKGKYKTSLNKPGVILILSNLQVAASDANKLSFNYNDKNALNPTTQKHKKSHLSIIHSNNPLMVHLVVEARHLLVDVCGFQDSEASIVVFSCEDGRVFF